MKISKKEFKFAVNKNEIIQINDVTEGKIISKTLNTEPNNFE